MKNLNFYHMKAVLVGLMILTLNYSCSIDSENELPNTEITAVDATYFEGICTNDCFPTGGPYVVKNGSTTVNAGINSKEMSYKAFNTDAVFVVEATYYVTEGNSKVDARITIEIDGDEVIFDKVSSGTTVTHFVQLKSNWQACDQINYNIEQTALGKPVKVSGNYELVAECLNPEPLKLGDKAKGGIITYLLGPNDPGYDPDIQHGLVITPTDISDGIQWYNGTYLSTGATATEFGSGQANTTTIVNEQGTGSYAAQLCDDLVYNYYTDWYLPSTEEMRKVYSYYRGYIQDDYWTSSESSDTQAISVYIQIIGNMFYDTPIDKSELRKVRAVRSF